MKINSFQAVGQIAVDLTEAIPVFEKYKIDYYSQGNRDLKDACYLAGAPLETVSAELESLAPAESEWYQLERDWRNEPISEVADYIIKTHHLYTRQQLDRIGQLMEDMMAAEPPPSPLIQNLFDFFRRMAKELRNHMREEEEVVFPYLVEVEKAFQRGEPPPRPFQGYNAFTHPIRILQEDHGMMGRDWMRIEEMTKGFTVPPDAGPLLRALYQAILELEKDNRKHMHLENNVLFHRAMKLGLLNQGEKMGSVI